MLKRAFILSLHTKSKLSVIVCILGFPFAFFPTIIAKEFEKLTNLVQELADGQAAFSAASKALFLLMSLLLIYTIFNCVQSCCLKLDSIRTQTYLKENILRIKCNVKYRFIENDENFQERIVFAEDGNGCVQAAESLQSIIYLVQQCILFLNISFTLYNISPWIITCILFTCLPAIVLSQKQKDETFKSRIKWMEEGALVLHYFFLCCGNESIQEVRYNRLHSYLKEQWKTSAKEYCRKKNQLIAKHVTYNTIADALRNVVFIIVLSIVAREIYCNPSVGLGLFSLTISLTAKLQKATTDLFVGMMQFVGDIPFIKEYFLLNDTEKDNLQPNASPLTIDEIEFKNVSFSYPNSNVIALNNVNLKIRAGEKIAVVGENGSGKTTFVNLLCGMFSPSCGEIFVNGKPITAQLSELRASTSVVFQDFGKYETTLRENITLSDPAKKVSDQDIIDLMRKVGCSDLLETETLNSQLGATSKTSKMFSGGQWQKIALARALYKTKSRFIILDEPTSALDPISEANLYRDFANLTEDRLTVLISHRLGVTSVVNRILVFCNGSIIADGTHLELMERCPYYADMYRAQAQWYITSK